MAPKNAKTLAAKQAFNPLILRSHRLMEVFAKSDDERDFLLDRLEGFLLFVDLEKPQAEIEALWDEVKANPDRYVMIPKLSFYETKKIMEGFINEKVYDIDTKEKLIEIISLREARENFLEFIYDHHSEMEKWQQYYVERSRIRIIEWLRANHFEFVFEEDLELTRDQVEKVKINLFEPKVSRDIDQSRKALALKAKTYYSNEALNPRPKRGRPPKQVQKAEVEREISLDIYTTVPLNLRPFLFTPEVIANQMATFSTRFETEGELLDRKRKVSEVDYQTTVDNLNLKLSELRTISSKWVKDVQPMDVNDIDIDDEEDNEIDFDEEVKRPKKESAKSSAKSPTKKAASVKKAPAAAPAKKPVAKIIPKAPVKTPAKPASKTTAKPAVKKPAPKKK